MRACGAPAEGVVALCATSHATSVGRSPSAGGATSMRMRFFSVSALRGFRMAMDRVADFALQTIGQMGKRDLSTAASRF